MNLNEFSPFIRVAMKSFLTAPFKINQRVLFDYELIFIESGKWKLTLENKEYICKENDVILIRPRQKHTIESIGNISVSQPHIHFDIIYDNFSEQIYVSFKDETQFSKTEMQMIRTDIFNPFNLSSPILKITNLIYFKNIFYHIISTFETKPLMFQLLYKQQLLELLTYIIKENFSEMVLTEKLPKQVTENIAYVIKEYIDHNYYAVITLDTLEKQFHYSKFSISKNFTKCFGISVIRYYNTLRLETAKNMLKNGSSVTEIVNDLNFSSIYMFSRLFKNNTDLSPTKYVKKHSQ